MQQKPWTVWCWSAISDGYPSFIAACCPFLDRACLRRLWRGVALLSNVRFTSEVVRPCILNGLVDNSSVDCCIVRWWGLARHGHDPCPGGRAVRHKGDVSSCAFCTSRVGDFTHGHLLPRLCRLEYPVVCSSPCGTSRSLFMDAALLDFQSVGFGQHPLHCARTCPVCWSGVCPRRFLHTATC